MILHAYTSTWNDLYMVKQYVHHWSQYAAKIFVYDDDSTDGTREFCKSMAPVVELKSPGFHGIDELLLQDMRRREYKLHSRGVADWVAIGDSDEFHHHPNFLEALAEKKRQGFCAVVSHGYQMFSESVPEGDLPLMETIKEGLYDMRYSRVIFSPEIDLRIGVGQHSFRIFDENGDPARAVSFSPTGRLRREVETAENITKYPICNDDQNFKMLHYKYLGEDYIRERHARSYSRLSARNLENGWGAHAAPGGYKYGYDVAWYRRHLSERQRVI